MIPQIRRTFNIREVKGGYVLSVSSYDGNNYLLNGTNTNESIHPGIDDLIQAIRFELINPQTANPSATATTRGTGVTVQGNQ